MKKGGKGKKMIVESVPFGGGDDNGFPNLGGPSREEKKGQVPKQQKVDESILSPEGASIRDICTFNERCTNMSCKSYHPMWATGICIPFAAGRCTFNACRSQHLEWANAIALAIPEEQLDIHYQTPFKGGKQVVPQQQAARKVVDLSKKEESKVIAQHPVVDLSEIMQQEESKSRSKPMSKKPQQQPANHRQVISESVTEQQQLIEKQKSTEVSMVNPEKKNDAQVLQVYASKLGTKTYFGGDNMSEVDEKAFKIMLEIGEEKVEELGSKNIKRWFNEMRLAQSEDAGSCSYCEKRINIPLYKVKIAAGVSEDLVIPCTQCAIHHSNLRANEETLQDQKYIKGNAFVEQEVKNYDKELKPLSHLIEKYKKTFPKLEAYMKMMKILTTQESVLCQVCNRKFDILRFENLLFGVKENTSFCVPCYEKHLNTLVTSGMQLGNQKNFFQDSWGQEVQLCKKLKPYKDYLKYTIYPNLIAWYELISDVLENPIVKCEGCPKEFKNHTAARFIKDDFSCYACSTQCRAKLHEKERREKQKQKKADLIDARYRQNQGSNNNQQSKDDALVAAEFEMQERLSEWISGHNDKKMVEEFENNALRLLKRLPQIEDISLIFKALAKNNNDAFHAMCELESNKPYNYIQMRYLSENNDSNFIKA